MLPPVNFFPRPPGTVSRGTISLPGYLIVTHRNSFQGRFGHLEFENDGVVTDTVPLYWSTTNVTMQPVTALPEWNPLEPAQFARVGAAQQPRQLEFTIEFSGCPPLRVELVIYWTLADGSWLESGGIVDKGRIDRIDLGGTPGKATVWVDEARLHQFPPGGTKLADWIDFSVTNVDGTTPGFPIRKPFSVTGMVGPNRIDLGFKKCWYEIDVEYTGGFPITRIVASDQKGNQSEYDVRWQIQQRRRTGDALLQIEIPAIAAIRTEGHIPSRVWVEVDQPRFEVGAGRVGFEVGVVNFPIPADAALPTGGCDWDAPSALPAHP